MVTYLCKTCNFSSENKYDYNRHCGTYKHRNNVKSNKDDKSLRQTNKYEKTQSQNSSKLTETQKNVYFCEGCNNKFSRLSNLTRHKKVCAGIINLAEKYAEVKEQMEYFKKLFEETGGMVKKSVSAISYSVNNFQDAPVLKTIEISDIEEFNIGDDIKVAENLLSAYKHKTLGQYLGNIIVSIYKKDDPKLQSLWSSDVNRLTYLVKQLLKKSSCWSIDKNGLFVRENLIDPIVDHVKILIAKYVNHTKTIDIKFGSVEFDLIMQNTKCAQDIVNDIDDGIIGKSILKTIAPHFKFDEKLLK